MKTAVLISGALISRSNKIENIIDNVKRMKEKFPDADFYFATWEPFKAQFESVFPGESCLYVKEFTPTYHPYLDMDPKDYIDSSYTAGVRWARGKKDRSLHQAKQVIIHAELVKSLPKEYDVIVRGRFDAYVAPEADFAQYVEESFETKKVFGFSNRMNGNIGKRKPARSASEYYLYDIIIIHPTSRFNPDYVFKLYDEKKLHASEYGWAQVLCMDDLSNQRSIEGWTCPDEKPGARIRN